MLFARLFHRSDKLSISYVFVLSELKFCRFVLSNRKKIEVDINAVDKDGWSALLYSVSARNHEFSKMLIYEGMF